MRELAESFGKDARTVRTLLEQYTPPHKKHRPRAIHLTADATYFGERTEATSWCVVVARDLYTKENLWWVFTTRETTNVYVQMRRELEALNYTILSVTGDGFGGLRTAFAGIPFQMCHVHMERIVINGTTQKPQLEAGKVLLALVRTLFDTDSHTFRTRLKQYFALYGRFIDEETTNPETGERFYTHDRLRTASLSLLNFERWLFTFEHDKKIPRTTNSLEGHFRHVNEVVAVHCGLKRNHKERVLHSILLAGTVAPSAEILEEIL